MFDKMKVKIYSQPWDGSTHIAFLVQRNGQWCMAKPVELQFEPLVEGEMSPPPSMSFHPEVAQEFLTAMAQALDDRGIKVDSQAKVEGKLEATQHHLEDMRGLLAWFTTQGDDDHGH